MNNHPGRYLGKGRATDFTVNPGEQLVEVGGDVFAVGQDFFCRHCDGASCKSCNWSGHESVRLSKRRKA